MKKIFVQTKPVSQFISVVQALTSRGEGVPGMALVYGEPGLGKSKTALWYANQGGGIFLRAKKLMTGRWLLEELVAELGESPAWKTADLFRQAVDILMTSQMPVMIDEVDYLTCDARVIETLRDLHDITGAPFVFIGEDMAAKKLARYRHLYDRFTEILKFQPLDHDDVARAATELTDISLAPETIDWIQAKTQGRMRRVIIALHRAEKIGRTKNLKQITEADISCSSGSSK